MFHGANGVEGLEGLDNLSGLNGLGTRAGLYIHVPFCSRICPYCDFAVRTAKEDRRRRFVERLVTEMELQGHADACFDTVYLGGGTPSLLESDSLERILSAVARRFPLALDSWTFLEANPEDVKPEKVAAWRRLGVGTLSLGVQSLSDGNLAFLGRRHTPEDAQRAVAIAREQDFHTISMDLIFGLPGQTLSDWRRELEAAVRLAPDHLSCYQLTLHQGTVLGRLAASGRLIELGEEPQAEMFRLTHAFLADCGFEGYEVSNFTASPAHRSRHNLKYWMQAPYLGLGPSAHSFDGERRWWNVRRLSLWESSIDEQRLPIEEQEILGARELVLEALMLGLRTRAGVDLARIAERYGVDLLDANRARIERYQAEGLLRLVGQRLEPTVAGLAVADGLAGSLELPP